jgi:hypothetical protein
MDRNIIDIFVDTMSALLENDVADVSVERLQARIKDFAPGFGDLSPEDLSLVERRVLARVQVVMGASTVVADQSWIPWVSRRRHEIETYYWDRYMSYLERSRKVPKNVRIELNSSVENVLDLTYDPNANGPWDRRGLVMGNVQSGKTQHYTGLICKAADAGYKIIVVIAGIHNNLRNQTQERLDEGFVGLRWSGVPGSKRSEVGVGLLDIPNHRRPASFTGLIKDFNKASAQSLNLPLASLKEPAVFVIKKNTKTLQELIEWLRSWNATGDGKIHEPLLLIDDEADNASINVGGDPEKISRINGQIRELLTLFDRSSYVGYTATPFANIFIDPDTEDQMVKEDLFPRSFIIDLEPPSNYLGPQKVFQDEPRKFLRDITDNELDLPLKHKIDWTVPQLPPTLDTALNCYLLSRAIRTLRGDGHLHSSMMVNVSRFNGIQGQVQTLVIEQLGTLRAAVKSYGGLGVNAERESTVLRQLKEVFDTEYHHCGCDWLEVLGVLHEAISPIDVVLVNMTRSTDPLQYDNYKSQGRHVIAIGGLSLSRGLTLEGLTISYFLRNSKMYDTLLQMGRWFGYRDSYEDLVRVYMPPDSQDWYEHITDAVEELRGELRAMAESGSSPKEFGLKVRRHPATLLITARNKFGRFGDVVLSTSFSNRLVETVRIRTDEIVENIRAVNWLSDELLLRGYEAVGESTHLEISKVDPAIVLAFLSKFSNSGSSESSLSTELVLKYLSDMSGEIDSWDVSVPTPKAIPADSPERVQMNFMGKKVYTQQRTPNRVRRKANGFSFLVSSKQRASSRGVESFCLPRELVERVRNEYPKKNIPDGEFRKYRVRPMLMIHFLSPILPEKKTEEFSNYEELVDEVDRLTSGVYPAWGISFPNFGDRDRAVEARYQVNATWLENEFGFTEDLEDDEEML